MKRAVLLILVVALVLSSANTYIICIAYGADSVDPDFSETARVAEIERLLAENSNLRAEVTCGTITSSKSTDIPMAWQNGDYYAAAMDANDVFKYGSGNVNTCLKRVASRSLSKSKDFVVTDIYAPDYVFYIN